MIGMKINAVIFNGKITRLLLVAVLAIPFTTRAQNFYDGTDDIAGAVPIRLVSFNAEKINGYVLLNWTTTSEYNNSHFNIQRSLNGTDFYTIATVSGKGNSAVTNNYSLMDSMVPNANLYYRLQQVDWDGKSTMSSIVLLKFSRQSTIELTVYPNPVVNHIARIGLRNVPAGLYTLLVKNIHGQIVFTSILNQTGNSSNAQLQLPLKLSAGLYIIGIENAEGKIKLSQKILIE
jgi:Secretion system C-terminal sorting domain